jgi:hypothetical protein
MNVIGRLFTLFYLKISTKLARDRGIMNFRYGQNFRLGRLCAWFPDDIAETRYINK